MFDADDERVVRPYPDLQSAVDDARQELFGDQPPVRSGGDRLPDAIRRVNARHDRG